MPNTGSSRTVMGTSLGLLAILFWSTSVAMTRRVAESFGTADGMAIAYCLGGLLGCIWLAMTGRLRQAFAMPRAYHWVCGGLMVLYGLCYTMAVGLARDHQAVLEVGILNYLWPGLTMLFALPILRRRATPLLIPGILLAFTGAAFSIGGGHGFSWAVFGHNLISCSLAHLLALAAAVVWGLYSNFNSRLAAHSDGAAAPLHLMALGVCLFLLRVITGQPAAWHPDPAGWICLLATALFPCLLGYLFWDIAMRKGNLHLVVPASYATPILSTLITALMLGVKPSPILWLSCALVAVGAILCKQAIKEPA